MGDCQSDAIVFGNYKFRNMLHIELNDNIAIMNTHSVSGTLRGIWKRALVMHDWEQQVFDAVVVALPRNPEMIDYCRWELEGGIC